MPKGLHLCYFFFIHLTVRLTNGTPDMCQALRMNDTNLTIVECAVVTGELGL